MEKLKNKGARYISVFFEDLSHRAGASPSEICNFAQVCVLYFRLMVWILHPEETIVMRWSRICLPWSDSAEKHNCYYSFFSDH